MDDVDSEDRAREGSLRAATKNNAGTFVVFLSSDLLGGFAESHRADGLCRQSTGAGIPLPHRCRMEVALRPSCQDDVPNSFLMSGQPE